MNIICSSRPFFRDHSYLARGKYVDQLLEWSRFFDRTQILVFRSEDLFSEMPTTLERILAFLGVPRWMPPKTYPIPNKREYSTMNPVTRQRLDAYFEP